MGGSGDHVLPRQLPGVDGLHYQQQGHHLSDGGGFILSMSVLLIENGTRGLFHKDTGRSGDGEGGGGLGFRLSPGGVGRNIAHNMSLMGLDVRLLTAFGDDVYAQKLAAVCGELGIDISQSPVIPGGHTSTYLFINDQQGDMQLAVSDMDIYRNLTPRVLAGRKQLLEGSQVVVIDTNLPAESIAWLADNCHAPIFADPVSTVKAEKLRPVLGKLHTLKPNRLEAELLSGVPITDTDSLHRAAQTLLETGLHRVFISLGADGVYAADQSGSVTLPAPKAEMVSTTGCGDSFMAALTWAYLQGSDLERSARAGLAASSLTMESTETIHPAMSETELLRRMAL